MDEPSPTLPSTGAAADSTADSEPPAASAAADAPTTLTEPNPADPAPTADGPTPAPDMPDYKGAPLDADCGPGLGCFWFQVALLVMLLILTPISVWLSAPSWLSAAFLIISLILLFFVGQTMVFLLRLVAADRRTRRRPLAPTARATVGQLEDAETAAAPAAPDPATPTPSDEDDTTPDEPLT